MYGEDQRHRLCNLDQQGLHMKLACAVQVGLETGGSELASV